MLLLLLTLVSGEGQKRSPFSVPHFTPMQAWGDSWHPFRASGPLCDKAEQEGRGSSIGVLILEGTS